jgi:hypothetical protein
MTCALTPLASIHQDFGEGEVLINHGGGTWLKRDYKGPRSPVFRSHFPVRYYLNDFELSVMFDPQSDPASRLVMGIPSACYGHTSQDYGKELAPEALEDAPYCPFKADVFQVGFCLREIFAVSSLSFRCTSHLGLN